MTIGSGDRADGLTGRRAPVEWLAESEMARRVRTFDWSNTMLGQLDGWPPGLASTVRLCLHSQFQMAVYAGPDLLFIYNDAERDILGQLHPNALGLPARELLRDSWAAVGPELEGVMADARSTWSVDRPLMFDFRGRKEMMYFTYSYSPVIEADGQVSGVLLITEDTTARVLAERRLETVTDVVARSMNAPTERRACESAVRALDGRPDIGFTMLYLVEGSSSRVPCVAASVGVDGATAGALVDLGPGVRFENAGWSGPVIDVRSAGVVVDTTDVLPPIVDHRVFARRAFVGPIMRGATEPPLGYLVVGLSEGRVYDQAYEASLQTLALGIGRSIGGARAREAERERATSIAALDEAKTTLFSNASHELRTPLALILGHLEELQQEGGLSSRGRDGLAVANRSAQRMLKLVNALLEFSRIEAGRQIGTFQPIDLAQLTREVASMFSSAAESLGLRFSLDCRAAPDPLWVDPEAWERIVSNLVSNAIKFTPGGEVIVSTFVAGARYCLTVEDTGIGIPAEDRERVFSRFYRSERSGARSHEGSGIGLALVRELVKLHGGAVEAGSRAGGGTVMTVRLPMRERGREGRVAPERTAVEVGSAARLFVAEAESWSKARAIGDGPAGGSSEAQMGTAGAPERRDRIVLAEDNPDMRRYLCRVLSPSYTVELARDGTEACELALRNPPAMVISDLMMPGLDGLALTRELRRAIQTHNVPVILVSAKADPETMAAALELGADDYIVKPFGARELLARTRATLENARSRSAAGITQGRTAEREMKNAELAALLNDLKAAQLRVAAAADAERRKIEQDLHDGAQQHLLGIGLQLDLLSESLDDDKPAARRTLQRVQSGVDAAIEELRELAHGLHPALLASHGLYAALSARARRLVNPVTVTGAHIGRVPREIESAVYFCCSEALQNVVKHAGADAHAGVKLKVRDGLLEFTVRDDGRGFEPGAGHAGIGLTNLRDRLEALGGDLELASSPGSGTTVRGQIPLP